MNIKLKNLSLLSLIFLTLVSCKNVVSVSELDEEIYSPKYACGFSISGATGATSTMITIKNPWQGADSVTTQLYVERNDEGVPDGFSGQVLKDKATRIVAMSSTHVAMLDAIGAIENVVGVSGLDYISNQYIVNNRDKIGDVGYDGNINYETLVAQSPDLVLLYGVNGASSMEGKLSELGIPYMYVGDYLEESPLGKAEWLVALAEVVGKRENAITVFNDIPKRYNAVKDRAKNVTYKPKVMINTPYQDSWFMPSNKSYIVQLISDAAGEYVYEKNNSTSSMPIDIEDAYLLASSSDKWINVGSMSSLEEMRSAYPKFSNTKPMLAGELYNSNKRVSANGANDYWESGVVNPDLVLRDLLKIMHPELVDEDFVYYQQLK